MRVTKRQLRRIIREEKRKVLAENRVRRTVRRILREGADKYSATVQRMITEPKAGAGGWAIGRDAVAQGTVPEGPNGWGDMRGADLSGENLSGIWFQDFDFSGADFSGADLSDAVFVKDLDFRGANFRDANMLGTNFWAAIRQGALDGADVTGATVDPFTASFIENKRPGATGPLNVVVDPSDPNQVRKAQDRDEATGDWDDAQRKAYLDRKSQRPEDEGITVYDWVDLVGRSDSIEQMLGYVEDALGPEAAAEYELADDGAEIFNGLPHDVQRRIADDLELSI